MNVGIKATRCDDIAFARNGVGAVAHDHILVHTVHHIWIACFPDTYDESVLDANVCFVDTSPINDERVGYDSVENFVVFAVGSLSHPFSKRLPAAELAFVAIDGEIFLDFDPEVCGAQADEIIFCGTKHTAVCFASHGERFESGVGVWLRNVGEASFLQFLEDGIRSRQIDSARCKVVATMDGFVASDFHQLNSLAVAWLKSNRSASSNIETVAISFDAIKFKLGISLDEVIVRSDLYIVK